MPALEPALRNTLENVTVAARAAAERACKAALERLNVHVEPAHGGISEDDRALRVTLRAEARRLGSFELLVNECAYEQWHRMLFARFLAENDLLMHPDGIAVSLADCADLAAHEGHADAWAAAASYASRMLPGIFREADPTLRIKLAPNERAELERLLEKIPQPVFTSDDGVGWVYQFWQTKAKKEVNKSGRKVGGADISPVTQLFTEHYMVEFLLHNTLGAWWAARRPDSLINASLRYLRRLEDGSPAAGAFEAWPRTTADLKVLDPCCGSGHFLTAAADLLARMRAEEEHLTEPDAFELVLAENLFGLELDARCTQLAAFALALQAWKRGGYRSLPVPNVACSGIPVGGQREEWTRLANGDAQLATTLGRLYDLFRNAPDLGSLIDPTQVAGDRYQSELMAADFGKVEGLLERALSRDRTDDPAASVFGEAARGASRALEILQRKYNLVTTNFPYLTRVKQSTKLRSHLEDYYPRSRTDLATAFVERSLSFVEVGGCVSFVSPQSWLYLGNYKELRRVLLTDFSLSMLCRVGSGAFSSIGGEVVSVSLQSVCRKVQNSSRFLYLDVEEFRTPEAKSEAMCNAPLVLVEQSAQLRAPDHRITGMSETASEMLGKYASAYNGTRTGDYPRFGRQFWEIPAIRLGWVKQNTTVDASMLYGGYSNTILWEDGKGQLAAYQEELARLAYTSGAWKQGVRARGRSGVLISQMGDLAATLYQGDFFDNNAAVIVPNQPDYLTAIWCFCSSPAYSAAVRAIDKSLKVTNGSLVKVPFDLAHWQQVASEKYPKGLPEPYSNDPTQWLFKGTVADTTAPLQVAVARFLGYRWPEQVEDGLEEDTDGIVCLPPVAGELPAAERLRSLLGRAFGERWSPTFQSALLGSAGATDLAVWLRDDFFVQHCRLFHNRPFVWHLWDGRKDGFGALVNYHKLDRSRLERLIYTHLGDWIKTQADAARNNVPGADLRLAAAQELKRKLELILHGEPPYDIFVRWKKLHEQPIGWDPDLNDGVRLNIRPFVTAGVLRSKFTINWNKDRGTDPSPNASGTTERHNDRHLTRAEKEAAREAAMGEKVGA